MFNDAPPPLGKVLGGRSAPRQGLGDRTRGALGPSVSTRGPDSGTDGWGKERRQRGVCIVTVITVTGVTINFLYLQKT